MEVEKSSKFKAVIQTLLISVLSLMIGRLLTKYALTDKPGIEYQIIEGQPIEIDSVMYYSTNIVISNTGDIPLGAVSIFLSFNGKIMNKSSNIFGDKNNDDSLNIIREFQVPKLLPRNLFLNPVRQMYQLDLLSLKGLSYF